VALLPFAVLLAYYYWLGQQHGTCIACSAAAILIFRGELAILLGLILLGELLTRRLSLVKYVTRFYC
jgi:alpha-1,6-mannosyltransferase